MGGSNGSQLPTDYCLKMIIDVQVKTQGSPGGGSMFGGMPGGPGGVPDLGGFLNNPALMNMATQMLSDPNMQNMSVSDITVLINNYR